MHLTNIQRVRLRIPTTFCTWHAHSVVEPDRGIVQSVFNLSVRTHKLFEITRLATATVCTGSTGSKFVK